MNLVKRFLVKRGIRDKIETLKEVKALVGASLLITLNFLTKLWLASLSYSLIRFTERLT